MLRWLLKQAIILGAAQDCDAPDSTGGQVFDTC